ncbi:medium-chain acyl-CoA ligase ACSF2, mitochondrial-like [Brevipalpus obovatus]|uniref:medium-chain acyl-CoA ligase ACSF2, mitochondrial-like n=1 Tax=Brevipalpus obovatus TaxID=246614 RepID=UPI003D9E2321
MMRIFRAVSAKVSLLGSIPRVKRINLLRPQPANFQANYYRFNSDIVSRSYVHPLVSYSQGLSSHPCVIDTIPTLLNQRADERGDKVCLVSHSEGIKKTFRELRDDANRLAGSLHHELGLKKGDTIGIWSLNSSIWVTTKLAADILGTVQATINPYYKIEELAYAIKQSKMKALFMPGPGSLFQNFNDFDGILNDPTLAKMIEDSCLTDIIFLDGTKKTDSIGKLRVHSIEELASLEYRSPPEILQDPDDPSILMYTSGTTGKPKGALVSQYSIINNCYFVSKRQAEISDQAVVCCPLPLFHSFALVHGLVSFIVNDGTLVLSGNRFDPRSVIESIIQNKCDLLICTTMAIDLLRLAERRKIKLDSLTNCVLGGALADVQIIKRLTTTDDGDSILFRSAGQSSEDRREASRSLNQYLGL